MMLTGVVFTLWSLQIAVSQEVGEQPHILLIMADDLGWNDVGYHNPEMITPTIDQLAGKGVKLDNYYVQTCCTPSRAQLLSGKYQIHTGLQHKVINPTQANGLPLELPTLADKLREVGYATHVVGKWHLGYYKKDYMPTYRGFDSHFGMLNGAGDHYTHVRCEWLRGRKSCGVDLRHNEEVIRNNTQYSTQLFAEKASELIRNHNPDQPLFLYLPFQAPHGPHQVPDEYVQMYSHIPNEKRRHFSGMVTCMDEAIRNVTDALREKGMWNNTVTIFTTDNGGARSSGSNWPLRGGKKTMWEGGLRGVGFMHGEMIANKSRTSRALMDISDWFPTLVNLAGGTVNESLALDGIDVWDAISHGGDSPRTELLHNIDPLHDKKGRRLKGHAFNSRKRAAIREGNWKLITGDPGKNAQVEPPTASPYSDIYRHVKREEDPRKNVWLFDVEIDPHESHDQSERHPDIVDRLMRKLAEYESTAVQCRYPRRDTRSSPDTNGGAWGPWRE